MAGFGTGIVVGAIGLLIIQYFARGFIGKWVKSKGGELGVYGKIPGGKEIKQSYHTKVRRGQYNSFFDPTRVWVD